MTGRADMTPDLETKEEEETGREGNGKMSSEYTVCACVGDIVKEKKS